MKAESYHNVYGYCRPYDITSHRNEHDAIVDILNRQGSAYNRTIILSDHGIEKRTYDYNELYQQRETERQHNHACSVPSGF